MIHYTAVDLDVVFEGFDQFSPTYKFVEINGVQVQVETINADQVRIVRIFSANPQDFLNPNLAPGTLMEWGPILK